MKTEEANEVIELLTALRDSAQGRAEYLRKKLEHYATTGDYVRLLDREAAMIDLAEVMSSAMRRLRTP